MRTQRRCRPRLNDDLVDYWLAKRHYVLPIIRELQAEVMTAAADIAAAVNTRMAATERPSIY